MKSRDKVGRLITTVLAVAIIMGPLVSNPAAQLYSNATMTAKADSRTKKSPESAVKDSARDAKSIASGDVKNVKGGAIVTMTITPSETNFLKKNEQMTVHFDKKNVDLAHLRYSTSSNAPFSYSRKDGTVTLTFNRDLQKGNYQITFAAPTKNVKAETSVDATLLNKQISLKPNVIKSVAQAATQQQNQSNAANQNQNQNQNENATASNQATTPQTSNASTGQQGQTGNSSTNQEQPTASQAAQSTTPQQSAQPAQQQQQQQASQNQQQMTAQQAIDKIMDHTTITPGTTQTGQDASQASSLNNVTTSAPNKPSPAATTSAATTQQSATQTKTTTDTSTSTTTTATPVAPVASTSTTENTTSQPTTPAATAPATATQPTQSSTTTPATSTTKAPAAQTTASASQTQTAPVTATPAPTTPTSTQTPATPVTTTSTSENTTSQPTTPAATTATTQPSTTTTVPSTDSTTSSSSPSATVTPNQDYVANTDQNGHTVVTTPEPTVSDPQTTLDQQIAASKNGDNSNQTNQPSNDQEDLFTHIQGRIDGLTNGKFNDAEQSQIVKAWPGVLNNIATDINAGKTNQVWYYSVPLATGQNALVTIDGTSDEINQILKSFGGQLKPGDFDQAEDISVLRKSKVYADYQKTAGNQSMSAADAFTNLFSHLAITFTNDSTTPAGTIMAPAATAPQSVWKTFLDAFKQAKNGNKDGAATTNTTTATTQNSSDDSNALFNQIQSQLNKLAAAGTSVEQQEILAELPWILNNLSSQMANNSANQHWLYRIPLTTGRYADLNFDGTTAQATQIMSALGQSMTPGAFDSAINVTNLQNSPLYKIYTTVAGFINNVSTTLKPIIDSINNALAPIKNFLTGLMGGNFDLSKLFSAVGNKLGAWVQSLGQQLSKVGNDLKSLGARLLPGALKALTVVVPVALILPVILMALPVLLPVLPLLGNLLLMPAFGLLLPLALPLFVGVLAPLALPILFAGLPLLLPLLLPALVLLPITLFNVAALPIALGALAVLNLGRIIRNAVLVQLAVQTVINTALIGLTAINFGVINTLLIKPILAVAGLLGALALPFLLAVPAVLLAIPAVLLAAPLALGFGAFLLNTPLRMLRHGLEAALLAPVLALPLTLLAGVANLLKPVGLSLLAFAAMNALTRMFSLGLNAFDSIVNAIKAALRIAFVGVTAAAWFALPSIARLILFFTLLLPLAGWFLRRFFLPLKVMGDLISAVKAGIKAILPVVAAATVTNVILTSVMGLNGLFNLANATLKPQLLNWGVALLLTVLAFIPISLAMLVGGLRRFVFPSLLTRLGRGLLGGLMLIPTGLALFLPVVNLIAGTLLLALPTLRKVSNRLLLPLFLLGGVLTAAVTSLMTTITKLVAAPVKATVAAAAGTALITVPLLLASMIAPRIVAWGLALLTAINLSIALRVALGINGLLKYAIKAIIKTLLVGGLLLTTPLWIGLPVLRWIPLLALGLTGLSVLNDGLIQIPLRMLTNRLLPLLAGALAILPLVLVTRPAVKLASGLGALLLAPLALLNVVLPFLVEPGRALLNGLTSGLRILALTAFNAGLLTLGGVLLRSLLAVLALATVPFWFIAPLVALNAPLLLLALPLAILPLSFFKNLVIDPLLKTALLLPLVFMAISLAILPLTLLQALGAAGQGLSNGLALLSSPLLYLLTTILPALFAVPLRLLGDGLALLLGLPVFLLVSIPLLLAALLLPGLIGLPVAAFLAALPAIPVLLGLAALNGLRFLNNGLLDLLGIGLPLLGGLALALPNLLNPLGNLINGLNFGLPLLIALNALRKLLADLFIGIPLQLVLNLLLPLATFLMARLALPLLNALLFPLTLINLGVLTRALQALLVTPALHLLNLLVSPLLGALVGGLATLLPRLAHAIFVHGLLLGLPLFGSFLPALLHAFLGRFFLPLGLKWLAGLPLLAVLATQALWFLNGAIHALNTALLGALTALIGSQIARLLGRTAINFLAVPFLLFGIRPVRFLNNLLGSLALVFAGNRLLPLALALLQRLTMQLATLVHFAIRGLTHTLSTLFLALPFGLFSVLGTLAALNMLNDLLVGVPVQLLLNVLLPLGVLLSLAVLLPLVSPLTFVANVLLGLIPGRILSTLLLVPALLLLNRALAWLPAFLIGGLLATLLPRALHALIHEGLLTGLPLFGLPIALLAATLLNHALLPLGFKWLSLLPLLGFVPLLLGAQVLWLIRAVRHAFNTLLLTLVNTLLNHLILSMLTGLPLLALVMLQGLFGLRPFHALNTVLLSILNTFLLNRALPLLAAHLVKRGMQLVGLGHFLLRALFNIPLVLSLALPGMIGLVGLLGFLLDIPLVLNQILLNHLLPLALALVTRVTLPLLTTLALPLIFLGSMLRGRLLSTLFLTPLMLLAVNLLSWLPGLLLGALLGLQRTLHALLLQGFLGLLAFGLPLLALGTQVLGALAALPIFFLQLLKNAFIVAPLLGLGLPLLTAAIVGAVLWAISPINWFLKLGAFALGLGLSLLTLPLWLLAPGLNFLRRLAVLALALLLPLVLFNGLVMGALNLFNTVLFGLFSIPLGILVGILDLLRRMFNHFVMNTLTNLTLFGLGLLLFTGLKVLVDIAKTLLHVGVLAFVILPILLGATALTTLVLSLLNGLVTLGATLLNNVVLNGLLFAALAGLGLLPLIGSQIISTGVRAFTLAAVLTLGLFLGLLRLGNRLVLSFVLGLINTATKAARNIAGALAGLGTIGTVLAALTPVPGHLLLAAVLFGLTTLPLALFLITLPLSLLTGLNNLIAKGLALLSLLTIPLNLLNTLIAAIVISGVVKLGLDLLNLPILLLTQAVLLGFIGLPLLLLNGLLKLGATLGLGALALGTSVLVPLLVLNAILFGLFSVAQPLLALILLGLPSLLPFFNLNIFLLGLLPLLGLGINGLKLLLLPLRMLTDGLGSLLAFGLTLLATRLFNKMFIIPVLTGIETLALLGLLGLLALPLTLLNNLLLSLLPALVAGQLARLVRLLFGGLPFFLGTLLVILLPLVINGLLTALIPGLNLITVPLGLLALLAIPLALLGMLGNIVNAVLVGIVVKHAIRLLLNLLADALVLATLPLILVGGLPLAILAVLAMSVLAPLAGLLLALGMILLPIALLMLLALPFVIFSMLALLPVFLPVLLVLIPLLLPLLLPTMLLGFFFNQILYWFLSPIFLQILIDPITDLKAFIISLYTMFINPIFYWAFAIIWIPVTIYTFIGMFVNWLNPLNWLFRGLATAALLALPTLLVLALRAFIHLRIGVLLTLNPLAGIPAFLLLGLARVGTLLLLNAFVINTFIATLPLTVYLFAVIVLDFIIVFANALLNLGINVPNVLTVWIIVPLETTLGVTFTLFNIVAMLALDALLTILSVPVIAGTTQLALLLATLANPLAALAAIGRFAVIGLSSVVAFLAGVFAIAETWLPAVFNAATFLFYLIFANPMWMLAQWTGLIPIIGWAVQLVTDWIYMPIGYWGTAVIAVFSFALYFRLIIPLVFSSVVGVIMLASILPVVLLTLPIALLGTLAFYGLTNLVAGIGTLLFLIIPSIIIGLPALAVILWFLAPIFLQLLVNPITDMKAFFISLYTMFINPVFYWAFDGIFIPVTIGSFIGMFINWLNPLNLLFKGLSLAALLALPTLLFLAVRALFHLQLSSLLTLNLFAGVPAFFTIGLAMLAGFNMLGLFFLNTFIATSPIIAYMFIVIVIDAILVFANALLNLGINVPNVLTVWVIVPLQANLGVLLTMINIVAMLLLDAGAAIVTLPIFVGLLQLGLVLAALANPLAALIAVNRFATIGIASIGAFLLGAFMLADTWLPVAFNGIAFLWYLILANPIWMLAQWTGLIPIIGWIVQLVTDWIYMPIGYWGTALIVVVSFALWLHTMVPLVFSAGIGMMLLLATLPVILLVLPVALIGALLFAGVTALNTLLPMLLVAIPTVIIGIASLILITWFLAPIALQLMVNPITDFKAFIVALYTMFNDPIYFWAFSIFWIPVTIYSFVGTFVNWLNPLNYLFLGVSLFALLALPTLALAGIRAFVHLQLSSLLTLNFFAGVPAFLMLGIAGLTAINLFATYVLNTFIATLPLVIYLFAALAVDFVVVFADAFLNLGINVPNVLTIWVMLPLEVTLGVVLTLFNVVLTLILNGLVTILALPIYAGSLQLGLLLAALANPLAALIAINRFAIVGLSSVLAFFAGIYMVAQTWLPAVFNMGTFLWYLIFGNPAWMLAQLVGLIPIIGWIVQLITDWIYMPIGYWGTGALAVLSFSLYWRFVMPLIFSAVIGMMSLVAILPIFLLVLPIALIGTVVFFGATALLAALGTLLLTIPGVIIGIAALILIVWFLAPITLQLLVNPIRDMEAFVISVYTMFINPIFYWAFAIMWIPLTFGSFIGMFVNWLNPFNYLTIGLALVGWLSLPVLLFSMIRAFVHLRVGALLTLNPIGGLLASMTLGIAQLGAILLLNGFFLNTFIATVPLAIYLVAVIIIDALIVFFDAFANLGINVPNVITVWVLVPLETSLAVFFTLINIVGMLLANGALIVGLLPIIVGSLQLGLMLTLLSNPLAAIIAANRFMVIGLSSVIAFIAGIYMIAQSWLPAVFNIVAFIWYTVLANPVWMLAQWIGLIPIIGWIVQLITDWIYMPIGYYGTALIAATGFALFFHTVLPLVFSATLGIMMLLSVLPVALLLLPIGLIGTALFFGAVDLIAAAITLLLAIPGTIIGVAALILIVWFFGPLFLQLTTNPIEDFKAFILATYTMFIHPVLYWAFWIIWIPLTINSFIGMFLNWLNPLNTINYIISWFGLFGGPITALLTFLFIDAVKFGSLILPFNFNFASSLVSFVAITASEALLLLTFINIGIIRPALMISLQLITIVNLELVIAFIVVFLNAFANLGINTPVTLTMWVLVPLFIIVPVFLTLMNFIVMMSLDNVTLLWSLPLAGLGIAVGLLGGMLAHPLMIPVILLTQAYLGLVTLGTFFAGMFMLAEEWLPHGYSLLASIWYLIFSNPLWMLAQWTGLIPIIGWAVQLVTDWIYMPIAYWGAGIIAALSFSIVVMGVFWQAFSANMIGLSLLVPLAPLAILPLLMITPLLLSIQLGMWLASTILIKLAFGLVDLSFELIPLLTLAISLLAVAALALPLLLVFGPLLLLGLPLLLLGLPLLVVPALLLAVPVLLLALPLLLLTVSLLTAPLHLLNDVISKGLAVLTTLLANGLGLLPLDLLNLAILNSILALNVLTLIANLIPGLLHKLVTVPLWLLSLVGLPLLLLKPFIKLDLLNNLIASTLWKTLALLATWPIFKAVTTLINGLLDLIRIPLRALLIGLPVFLGALLLNNMVLGPMLNILLPLVTALTVGGLLTALNVVQTLLAGFNFALSALGLILPILNLVRRAAFWALLGWQLLTAPLHLLTNSLLLAGPALLTVLNVLLGNALAKLLLLPIVNLLLPVLAFLATLPLKLLFDALALPLILSAGLLLPLLAAHALSLLKLLPDLATLFGNPVLHALMKVTKLLLLPLFLLTWPLVLTLDLADKLLSANNRLLMLPFKIGNLLKDLLGPLSWLPLNLLNNGLANILRPLVALAILGLLLLPIGPIKWLPILALVPVWLNLLGKGLKTFANGLGDLALAATLPLLAGALALAMTPLISTLLTLPAFVLALKALTDLNFTLFKTLLPALILGTLVALNGGLINALLGLPLLLLQGLKALVTGNLLLLLGLPGLVPFRNLLLAGMFILGFLPALINALALPFELFVKPVLDLIRNIALPLLTFVTLRGLTRLLGFGPISKWLNPLTWIKSLNAMLLPELLLGLLTVPVLLAALPTQGLWLARVITYALATPLLMALATLLTRSLARHLGRFLTLAVGGPLLLFGLRPLLALNTAIKSLVKGAALNRIVPLVLDNLVKNMMRIGSTFVFVLRGLRHLGEMLLGFVIAPGVLGLFGMVRTINDAVVGIPLALLLNHIVLPLITWFALRIMLPLLSPLAFLANFVIGGLLGRFLTTVLALPLVWLTNSLLQWLPGLLLTGLTTIMPRLIHAVLNDLLIGLPLFGGLTISSLGQLLRWLLLPLGFKWLALIPTLPLLLVLPWTIRTVLHALNTLALTLLNTLLAHGLFSTLTNVLGLPLMILFGLFGLRPLRLLNNLLSAGLHTILFNLIAPFILSGLAKHVLRLLGFNRFLLHGLLNLPMFIFNLPNILPGFLGNLGLLNGLGDLFFRIPVQLLLNRILPLLTWLGTRLLLPGLNLLIGLPLTMLITMPLGRVLSTLFLTPLLKLGNDLLSLLPGLLFGLATMLPRLLTGLLVQGLTGLPLFGALLPTLLGLVTRHALLPLGFKWLALIPSLPLLLPALWLGLGLQHALNTLLLVPLNAVLATALINGLNHGLINLIVVPFTLFGLRPLHLINTLLGTFGLAWLLNRAIPTLLGGLAGLLVGLTGLTFWTLRGLNNGLQFIGLPGILALAAGLGFLNSLLWLIVGLPLSFVLNATLPLMTWFTLRGLNRLVGLPLTVITLGLLNRIILTALTLPLVVLAGQLLGGLAPAMLGGFTVAGLRLLISLLTPLVALGLPLLAQLPLALVDTIAKWLLLPFGFKWLSFLPGLIGMIGSWLLLPLGFKWLALAPLFNLGLPLLSGLPLLINGLFLLNTLPASLLAGLLFGLPAALLGGLLAPALALPWLLFGFHPLTNLFTLLNSLLLTGLVNLLLPTLIALGQKALMNLAGLALPLLNLLGTLIPLGLLALTLFNSLVKPILNLGRQLLLGLVALPLTLLGLAKAIFDTMIRLPLQTFLLFALPLGLATLNFVGLLPLNLLNVVAIGLPLLGLWALNSVLRSLAPALFGAFLANVLKNLLNRLGHVINGLNFLLGNPLGFLFNLPMLTIGGLLGLGKALQNLIPNLFKNLLILGALDNLGTFLYVIGLPVVLFYPLIAALRLIPTIAMIKTLLDPLLQLMINVPLLGLVNLLAPVLVASLLLPIFVNALVKLTPLAVFLGLFPLLDLLDAMALPVIAGLAGFIGLLPIIGLLNNMLSGTKIIVLPIIISILVPVFLLPLGLGLPLVLVGFGLPLVGLVLPLLGLILGFFGLGLPFLGLSLLLPVLSLSLLVTLPLVTAVLPILVLVLAPVLLIGFNFVFLPMILPGFFAILVPILLPLVLVVGLPVLGINVLPLL
ncbi:hypothetical protein ACRYI5_08380, partial [Furfurilactobacillus sp. WILCCON 0119]